MPVNRHFWESLDMIFALFYALFYVSLERVLLWISLAKVLHVRYMWHVNLNKYCRFSFKFSKIFRHYKMREFVLHDFCTRYIIVICSCTLQGICYLISEAFICHYTYYCTLLLALMHLACYYNHVTAFNLRSSGV